MEELLLSAMKKIIEKCYHHNLTLNDEKEINYGVQLKFSRGELEIPLNIYFSKKKGVSYVIGGSPKNLLRWEMEQIVSSKQTIATHKKSMHNWKMWAGSDESGKGDFFGALVTASFIMTEKIQKDISTWGIQDSKKIKDSDIIKLAKRLYKNYRSHIEVLVLRPQKYNELYNKFREKNKKLNALLAWMHTRIILNLKEKHNFEGAVVDKFSSDSNLISSLKDFKEIKLVHRIKAEEDSAVACASIIARYHFLQSIDELSEKYGIKFPKGASKKVISQGKIFAEKFSLERLNEVAKIHFVTYEKIEATLNKKEIK